MRAVLLAMLGAMVVLGLVKLIAVLSNRRSTKKVDEVLKMPTGQQIIDANGSALGELLSVSVHEPSLEVGLEGINGLPVRCYLTQAGFMASRLGKAVNGTAYKGADAYHVFVDANGDQDIANATSPEVGYRFVVLHEYGHAIHGDLCGDRQFEPTKSYTEEELFPQRREAYAQGYAFDRLIRELAAAREVGWAEIARYNYNIELTAGRAVGPGQGDYDQLFGQSAT